jgi:hypothetical protein
MKDLQSNEVVEWLRHQAKSLFNAADALEALSSDKSTIRRSLGAAPQSNGASGQAGNITIELLEKRVKHKNSRVRNVAEHFGVSQQQVKALLDEPNCPVVMGPRGWLKLRPQLELESRK